MRNQFTIATLLVLSTCVPAALAQDYPRDSQLKYQVWNGSEWASSVIARPGDRIEMRVVVNYTGTAPVVGLGGVAFQPTFSNWDNAGPSMDNLGSWRNNGVNSANITTRTSTGYLSPTEGASGSALPSYGRVSFAQFGTTSSMQNVITSFRHTNGSGNAPSGSWMRVSGSFGSQWPQSGENTWTTDDANRVGRGITASQWASINPAFTSTARVNPFWIGGSTDVPIFRQAVLLSDLTASRVIEIFSEQSSLDRVGRPVSEPLSTDSSDNRRYMDWRTQTVSSGSTGDLRNSVEIIPAQIIVSPNIPAPSAVLMLALSGVFASRRRR